ncbi:site-2 protease family protein [Paeniglutamicibacter sp. NPDC091659]|uniref:site-2 protease family protein n=1 Tax=Paeniglutamicibacter sp. NPDC091659 TaxID=3364389 RepID=UPI0037FDA5AA
MTETPAKREGIPLGSFFGVPVSLAWSWFLIAAFIVVVFGPQVDRAIPGLGYGAYVVAFAYAVLLALSVLVHELAHAVTAKGFGWPGARIVLNLWGGHTQFSSFNATPGRSLAVAMAGPAANFVIAGVGYVLLHLVNPTGVTFLLWDILVWANLLVALFNILPGLPLDGGRLVESAVWKATGSQDRGTVAAGWAGRVLVVLIVGYFVISPLTRNEPLDFQVLLVAILIGGFMWTGASQIIAHAKLRLRLPLVSVRALMEPATALAVDSTLADVSARIASRGGRVILIDQAGTPQGVIDEFTLGQVDPGLLAGSPALSAARALSPGAVVSDTADGRALIGYLATLEGSEYAVIDEQNRIIGLLDQANIVAAITGKPQQPHAH